MKKLIPLLIVMFVAACSSDDNISDSNFEITEKRAVIAKTQNDKGMYENYFTALVSNSSTHDVKGHVIFYIKEYGGVKSYTHTVESNKKSEAYFSASLETEKIIDESYLLKAEFVRE